MAKGKFEREDEMMDKNLLGLGVNFTDLTAEVPVEAEFETAETEEHGIAWGELKKPALFLALSIGIAVCERMGLMAEVIAVPSMWVCAAIFGRNTKMQM